MATLSIQWPIHNDMLITLSSVRSSTMAAGTYLNNSAGITCDIWKANSTTSTANRVVTARAMTYVAASNGIYRCTIQSTEHTMTTGLHGLAIATLSTGGLNGEWRGHFVVLTRGTT